MTIEEEIQSYIRAKVPVLIVHNDEIGTWRWSVAPVDKDDFWLDCFPTEAEAVTFCTENSLPLVGTVTSTGTTFRVDEMMDVNPSKSHNAEFIIAWIPPVGIAAKVFTAVRGSGRPPMWCCWQSRWRPNDPDIEMVSFVKYALVLHDPSDPEVGELGRGRFERANHTGKGQVANVLRFALDPPKPGDAWWPQAEEWFADGIRLLTFSWGGRFILINPVTGREEAPWKEKP